MERGVLVVGESLVDIVQTPSGRRHEYAGGSAANVAVALARLGRPTRLRDVLRRRRPRPAVATYLERAGVALATDPHAVARTSTALATIGTRGARGVHLRHRLAATPLDPDEAPAGRAHLLARGGADARCRRRAWRCSAGCGRALDDQLRRQRPAHRDRHRTRRRGARSSGWWRVTDLVKASDEDLEALYPGAAVRASGGRAARRSGRRRSW